MTREEALRASRIDPVLMGQLARMMEQRSALKQQRSFVCPRCLAQSFNPHDIEHRYCGRCHMFIRSAAPLSQSTTHLGPDPPQPRPRRQEDADWIEDGGWSGKR